MEAEYAEIAEARGDHCLFGLFVCLFVCFRKLKIYYCRFRNMGKETEDESEVDKPVLEGKDMLVIKNRCFEVQDRR